MVANRRWAREELLLALRLYCQLPFGRLHAHNPDVIQLARAMGRSPSALAMKLVNIASLDPTITSTGRSGLRNTSAGDRSAWEEMQGDWDRFAVESQQIAERMGILSEFPDSPTEQEAPTHAGEDRTVQTTARVGQRFFRAAVLSAYDERCCITGLSLPSLLVASHIIPWSHDASTRVNPRNGLLLSALHDRAFDSGIITITDDMTVYVSEQYRRRQDRFLSESISTYHGRPISLPHKFEPDREFLRYHREHIFGARG